MYPTQASTIRQISHSEENTVIELLNTKLYLCQVFRDRLLIGTSTVKVLEGMKIFYLEEVFIITEKNYKQLICENILIIPIYLNYYIINQSLFVVITTGFDIYYIIFRFESGDFLLQRKIQFGYVLETFENYNKRKTLVGPQVIPRSLALPNEAKWLQKSDVLLWKT